MKITVKLFASLSQYLPPGATRNEIELDVAEGITPAALVRQLEVPPEQAHLVMIDGIYVPPEERATRALKSNEQLAIFPPVAGGSPAGHARRVGTGSAKTRRN